MYVSVTDGIFKWFMVYTITGNFKLSKTLSHLTLVIDKGCKC